MALNLLGKKLVRYISGERVSGVIDEVEAYLGAEDPSCHTYEFRKSERNKVMYEPGGTAYVYFTYGMYHCFNVVSSKKGVPEAVLIRGVVPLDGIETMKKNRNKTDLKNLTNGPAKLCQAFQIDRSLNGSSLLGKDFFIEEGVDVNQKDILVSERIGLGGEHDSTHWPLRFYLEADFFQKKQIRI